MGNGRVAADHLQTKVETLYCENELNDDLIDYTYMYSLYENASRSVCRAIGVHEQRDWNAYGCGYASFLDSWFYFESSEYKLKPLTDNRKRYTGLTVVFSLLEPMFCVFENQKEWNEYGGGGALPDSSMIDKFETEEVRNLSVRICGVIQEMGIPRASRKTLETPINKSIQIETNLSFGELKLFDAFFHWMD